MTPYDVATADSRPPLASDPSTVVPADVLVMDAQPETYLPVLQNSFRVVAAAKPSIAFESMTRVVPAAMVADLDTSDTSAIDVIHRARSFSMPPAILATTSNPERAPEALLVGCDSILLKPFPPNLLYSRLSRLIRLRAQTLRQQSVLMRDRGVRRSAMPDSGRDHAARLAAGCTKTWPTSRCPHCEHEGVTSFEYASHRRAWYACLACRRVWMAKRRD